MSSGNLEDGVVLEVPLQGSLDSDSVDVNNENVEHFPLKNETQVEDIIEGDKEFTGSSCENDAGLPTENQHVVEDDTKTEKDPISMNQKNDADLSKENGLQDTKPHDINTQDPLLEMVLELSFQIDYMKSHFKELNSLQSDFGGHYQLERGILQDEGAYEDVKTLNAKLDTLSKELLEERQTRGAAEEALKHLRAVYIEADAKSQELSAKLAEAQLKMDEQLKERDIKYSDLDSKFSRLHKRAKQRIQEVQKEKEDLEAQFCDVNEKSERALLQQSTLQEELERTRQQANETLKVMDIERQQLRSANNKLRDNLEELRRSLQPKEDVIGTLQNSVIEKEQLLENMQELLKAAEEKRQTSMAELSSKHRKHIESYEAQLADMMSERSKATETISTLQKMVAERESKIADMDVASSGEVARLKAAMETVKGELIQLNQEHDKEKESWQSALLSLNLKLEVAESNCIRAEIEAAKMKSQLESELSAKTRLLNMRDAELLTAKEEITRLDSEFASYKVRAHALLQRKDAEVEAAKNNDLLRDQEEAMKEAEKEITLASAERDKALQDLKNALDDHDKEISTRDLALSKAEQQIKNMEKKLNSLLSSHASEKDTWEKNQQNLEETWRSRYEALKAQNQLASIENPQKEMESLKLHYKKLKEEHDAFRDLADKMIEEKDTEISRLLNDNKNLHQSLSSNTLVNSIDNQNTVLQKLDVPNLSTSAEEHQILILARQQAQREEELAQSQRHILVLQEEIEELERENRLHSQQETMLKEEVRNMERMQKRGGVDMTYLKNVILKLLETGEVGALLPVVAMLLQFSPEEMQKCQQAYRSSTEAQSTPATDATGSGLSLFSRFSFS
ncbi:protein GRIP isoform X2 [Apium graveolens]|uniref:GRIP domain-containing protein n=1 Tax=Apium graveolens TaxID=4045 RepID=A0A6L5B893_APIGR|nr:hypothetical protein AG4045_004558 [Apium graveolens]